MLSLDLTHRQLRLWVRVGALLIAPWVLRWRRRRRPNASSNGPEPSSDDAASSSAATLLSAATKRSVACDKCRTILVDLATRVDRGTIDASLPERISLDHYATVLCRDCSGRVQSSTLIVLYRDLGDQIRRRRLEWNRARFAAARWWWRLKYRQACRGRQRFYEYTDAAAKFSFDLSVESRAVGVRQQVPSSSQSSEGLVKATLWRPVVNYAQKGLCERCPPIAVSLAHRITCIVWNSVGRHARDVVEATVRAAFARHAVLMCGDCRRTFTSAWMTSFIAVVTRAVDSATKAFGRLWRRVLRKRALKSAMTFDKTLGQLTFIFRPLELVPGGSPSDPQHAQTLCRRCQPIAEVAIRYFRTSTRWNPRHTKSVANLLCDACFEKWLIVMGGAAPANHRRFMKAQTLIRRFLLRRSLQLRSSRNAVEDSTTTAAAMPQNRLHPACIVSASVALTNQLTSHLKSTESHHFDCAKKCHHIADAFVRKWTHYEVMPRTCARDRCDNAPRVAPVTSEPPPPPTRRHLAEMSGVLSRTVSQSSMVVDRVAAADAAPPNVSGASATATDAPIRGARYLPHAESMNGSLPFAYVHDARRYAHTAMCTKCATELDVSLEEHRRQQRAPGQSGPTTTSPSLLTKRPPVLLILTVYRVLRVCCLVQRRWRWQRYYRRRRHIRGALPKIIGSDPAAPSSTSVASRRVTALSPLIAMRRTGPVRQETLVDPPASPNAAVTASATEELLVPCGRCAPIVEELIHCHITRSTRFYMTDAEERVDKERSYRRVLCAQCGGQVGRWMAAAQTLRNRATWAAARWIMFITRKKRRGTQQQL